MRIRLSDRKISVILLAVLIAVFTVACEQPVGQSNPISNSGNDATNTGDTGSTGNSGDTPLVFAPELQMEVIQNPAELQAGAAFGYSVAIGGEYAFIGAPGTNGDPGSNAGAIYISKRTGDTWGPRVKLLAEDSASGDSFGNSVAIDGDYALVGANNHDSEGSNAGAAYVYKLTDDAWGLQTKLVADDASSGDTFGTIVAINGNYAIISSLGDASNGGYLEGSAYIFKRTGDTWTQEMKLVADDAESLDLFGYSVAINDSYAVVGAAYTSENGTESGSAYIFERTGNTWSQHAKIIGNGIDSYDYFGTSVAIDNDNTVFVGASKTSVGTAHNAGAIYVFSRTDDTWNQDARLTTSDASPNDQFARSLDIDGTNLIVGSPGNDASGNSHGAAYVFSKVDNVWTEQEKLASPAAEDGDKLGFAVAVDGGYALVGAYTADGVSLSNEPLIESGAVHIFSLF